YNTISNDALQYTKASVIDLVAGGVVYVGQPLDTVKVKLQTFPSLYNGMTDCFMRTLRNDRLRGLYAGTCPALAANIAENSILFAAYGLCQKGKNFSPWKLTGNIIRDEGVFGLYRGFQSTLLREMPGYFFFFGGYEISRILLTPKGKTKDEIG
ncbi:Mitochondrial ornithine transporter 1, partial [Armadillidium vulgare]